MQPSSADAAEPADDAPLPFDNPEAYLAEDRRRAIGAGVELPELASGSALFADISGFTPLTEALVAELGPRRGAERLTTVLDDVSGRLLTVLHSYGGSVIYFSGDAITCWLDGDDGSLAVACGLVMQDVLDALSVIALPSGPVVRLGLKVAVAVGSARRFVVGDPNIQLIDVLAGSLIEDLAAAEQHCSPGEVVLSGGGKVFRDQLEIAEVRTEPETGREFAVVAAARLGVELPAPTGAVDPLPEDVVRPWLLPVVYERLSTGRGEFLAELRSAVPLFLRFGGIDYDGDPLARQQLDVFVARAQRIVAGYGGNALQLTIGDKGAYLYCVFGSPIAHEDDRARACAAAVELSRLDLHTSVTGIQIGIAEGRLRSGTYGHASRRTFCCLGDAVNLAARLMSAAPPGGIYVAGAVQAAVRDRFSWRQLAELPIKGKSAPEQVYALTGQRRAAVSSPVVGTRRIVGRAAELADLERQLRQARTGRGRIIAISAEAGMGKSLLLSAAAALPVAAEFRWLRSSAPAFGVTASYAAWHEIWLAAFDVAEGPPEAQVAQLDAMLADLDAGLTARLPLLGAVLGIPVPDNDITSAFDAKLRKASTEQLVGECLTALAARRPMVVVIEDCHWLDALSVDLLETLARMVETLPVVLLLAYRPESAADDLGWPSRLAGLSNFSRTSLAELDPASARAMIGERFREIFANPDEPPAALVEFALARCEGNPFHIEELRTFVRARGVPPDDADGLAELDVPGTLNSLILSRIDVLAESPRRTVKVASVLGRDFRVPLLRQTYPALGERSEVTASLQELEQRDLVLSAHQADEAFLFRHAVIRDVAYDSMPFALREALHENAASVIESDPQGGQQLDLLAYHYWHSANDDKKRQYLVLAGDAAQAGYANTAAIDYYRRASNLVAGADRFALLLKLGKVLELVGDWPDAEARYVEALGLADETGDRTWHARARAALAEVARKQGRYDEAAAALAEAEQDFAALGDEVGQGQVLHIGGTLAAQRGDYELARRNYAASLQIRQRLEDLPNVAALFSNLAIVAEYENDLARARVLSQRSLQLRRQTGDRWAVGISQNNLGLILLLQGELDAARECFAESMALHREVGDLWMVAMGHNNLGNAMRLLGEPAQAGPHFAESLRGYRRFDEKWAIAILYEDIAVQAVDLGRAEAACQLDGAALTLREQLGSPRSPSQQDALHTALSRLDSATGEVSVWTAAGRSLTPTAADDVAFSVCLT